MGVVLIIAILEISNRENEFDVNSRNIRPSKITRYTVDTGTECRVARRIIEVLPGIN